MVLINQGRIAPDPWVRVADDADLPGDGRPALVSLARWQRDRDTLARYNGSLGLRLAANQSPASVAADLDRFDLVALEFPKFTDGRAYSHARLLRTRFRFAGELRATGQVLRDQLLFMVRCGFDAFEMAKESDAAVFARALAEIGTVYQPAADERVPAWRRRTPAADPLRRAPESTEEFACAGAWAY